MRATLNPTAAPIRMALPPKREPGNLTHSQKVKLWLAAVIFCAAAWSIVLGLVIAVSRLMVGRWVGL